jgi:hypothetical protein
VQVIYEASLRFPHIGFQLLQMNLNHLKAKFEKMMNEVSMHDLMSLDWLVYKYNDYAS